MDMDPTRRPWSQLIPLALERIRELLDFNLYDVLRLRSVCSGWRKALAHPRRPRLPHLPINLPPFPEGEKEEMTETTDCPSILNCSRIYRISPANDPSNGWLIRSLDSKPSTFTLLDPLRTIRVRYPPHTLPNSIDLLQFRITEICECYRIDGVGWDDVLRVLFLPHFVEGVEFTVLALFPSGTLYYCNRGDSAWTPIEGLPGLWVDDVLLFGGVCYVLSQDTSLASLDSNFHLTKVVRRVKRCSSDPCRYEERSLAMSETDLFLVIVLSGPDLLDKDVLIFKRVLNRWCEVRDLGDSFLLSSSDVSLVLSANDFKGCRGNFVFFSDAFSNRSYDEEYMINLDTVIEFKHEVYDLDLRTNLHRGDKLGRINICWPPPKWIINPTSE